MPEPITGRRRPGSGARTGGQVGRHFAALAIGELAARGTTFVVTVYLARTLGASGYGVIGFAGAVVLYLARIADAGMEFFGLGIREIAEDPRRVATTVPGVLLARSAATAVLVGLLAVLSTVLPQPDGEVLVLTGLGLFSVALSTRWVLLGLERPAAIATIRIAGGVIVAVLTLVLVRGPDDLLRAPVAGVVGDSVAAALLLFALARAGFALRPRFNGAAVWPLLLRSLPLVVTSLLGLVIYNADLLMLRVLRGAEAVGYYAAAYTLISLMLNLGAVYSQSLLPAITRAGAHPAERRGLYHDASAQLFAIGLPVAWGGALVAPALIALIFGPGYTASVQPLQILLWCVPLALAREVATVPLIVSERQHAVLRVTTISAGVALAANFALIPSLGLRGAALATVATEVIRLGLTVSKAHAAGFGTPHLQRLWRPALAGAAMAGTLLLLRPPSLWFAVGTGMFAYLGALAFVGGLRFDRGTLPYLNV